MDGKKIIRLHGGKIIGYGYGKVVTYQVIMPKYFQSQSEADTGMALSVKKQKVYLEETVSTAEGKSRTDKKRVNLVFCWLWQTKSIVII